MAKKKEELCCKDGGKCECDDKNPFVTIPSALAGIFAGILVLFLIFANDQLGLTIPIVWAFVVLGAIALVVSYKAEKNRK